MKTIFERYAENINYYQAPGMPGNRVVIFTDDGKIYTDENPSGCTATEFENYINYKAIPWAFMNGIYLYGVDHGNFIRNRKYCAAKEVVDKTEEDYSLNYDVLNYVHAAMVASEEHANGKAGITVVEYIGESDMSWVHEFKDAVGYEQYVGEFLKEIKEEE